MTMSAPCASASAIGRAPRYADANSGGAGQSRRTARRCRGARTARRPRAASSRRREQVVAEHGRDRDAGDAELLARSRSRPRAAAGGVDAAGVGDDLRAPVGDVRQRARQVRGQVARVAARLVALAVLLQDRERQLGERLEAEVVDALGEQRVDRRGRVAVEALPARDGRPDWSRLRRSLRRGSAAAGRPTAAPPRAARRPGRARPPGTVPPTSCTPIGSPSADPGRRQRDRGLAGDVERRGVRARTAAHAPAPRSGSSGGRRRRRASGGGSASVGVSSRSKPSSNHQRRRCAASTRAPRAAPRRSRAG